MNKSKANLAVVSTLLFALIPKFDKDIKRQMLSLISLVISSMFVMVPFIPAAAAGPVSYTVHKTVIDVAGKGPAGNVTTAGDVIAYEINVNNTAGMNLTNVTVNDPMIGIINNVTNLSEGSNETLYGNYTVTQEDINNNGNGTGFIINNVTVVCDQNTTANNATVAVPIKGCTIVMNVTGVTGDGNGNVTAAGDIISYQISVNNTAGMDLTNVTVNDPMLGGILLNMTSFSIGSNETLYGNYTVTRADITNYGNGTGFIINNATVDCDQLGPKNATAAVPIDTAASIEGIVTDVAGHGPGGNVTAVGDIITYHVNVTNNGITNLTNVTVNSTLTNLIKSLINNDTINNGTINNGTINNGTINNGTINNSTINNGTINNDTILNPGETWTYTGNYTVTQADIENNGTVKSGLINNGTTFATALALKGLVKSTEASEAARDGFISNKVTFNSDQLGPKDDTIQVPIERKPHYSIQKSVINPDASGDCIVNTPGDEIPYRIVVCNDGNVDLTNVKVKDPMISLTGPTGDNDKDGVLNPGETWVYNGIYRLTQDDINTGIGNIINTATVSSNELPEESSNVSQPIEQKADLSIQKSIAGIDEDGDLMINQPGDVINYRIAVENNGNVNLHHVRVTDSLIKDLAGPTGDSAGSGVLNPGETWIFKGSYAVTKADIDTNGDGTGFITNTATVHCTEHSSESSSVMVPIIQSSNFGTNTNSGSNQPEASFSTSVTSGYAPLTVQFTDTSTGTPTSWSWDFGDGGNSAQQSPVYTYNTPGTYTAKLTVSNANGSGSTTKTITVQQTTGSSGGGSGHSSGGSIGSASVTGSSSTDGTGTANVTKPETNTSNIEPSTTPANVEPTPVQTATSTPAKQSYKTPGFEIICGITALFAALLYRRK